MCVVRVTPAPGTSLEALKSAGTTDNDSLSLADTIREQLQLHFLGKLKMLPVDIP